MLVERPPGEWTPKIDKYVSRAELEKELEEIL